MKKTFIIAVICATSMVCMMACSNNKLSEVTEEPVIEAAVEVEAPVVEETVEKAVVENDEVGTYTFSDDFYTYKLTLNDDGTAVINSTQMNLTDYGSWEKMYGNYISVNCSGDQFRITLPDGSRESTFLMYLKNGYVYFGPTERDAKHPKKRLAYTKR